MAEMKGRLLAKVGDVEIFEADVKGVKEAMPPEIKMSYQGEEGDKKLLDEIIYQELFYLDALDKGLNNSLEYKQRLEEFSRGILRDMNISKTIADAKVSDEEVRKFYNEHDAELTRSEIRASHILVETEEAAKKAMERIEAGEDFADVAKELSSCPSKEHGGDLGFFGQGAMVPEFELAVWPAEKDKLVGPVKTQFGYHVIKKTDEKKPEKMKFDEVKEAIARTLLLTKQNELFHNKTEEFMKKYEVKRF